MSQLLLRRFCGLLPVLSVLLCVCVEKEKEKIENRTAHFFFVFLDVNFREFSFGKIICEFLDGYERAQVWRGAATAREWMPAILPTGSTLLKPQIFIQRKKEIQSKSLEIY